MGKAEIDGGKGRDRRSPGREKKGKNSPCQGGGVGGVEAQGHGGSRDGPGQGEENNDSLSLTFYFNSDGCFRGLRWSLQLSQFGVGRISVLGALRAVYLGSGP